MQSDRGGNGGVSRRQFLKGSGVAAAGVGLVGRAGNAGAAPGPEELKTQGATTTTTVCPYCAVGCGMVVSTRDGKIVNIEGDPEHPINRGSLCAKGSALFQVANNERRLQTVRYRAPGSDHWEEKSWEWAMDTIAQRVKATRDRTFVAREKVGTDAMEYEVNRTDGLALLGGASLDNEECYLWGKLARALGVGYLEHQARI